MFRAASLVTCLVALVSASASFAQQAEVRQELFGAADRAMQEANEAGANVLAPDSYQDASDRYRRAEQNLSRGRSLQDIRTDLAEAVRLFQQAIDRAQIARVSITAAVQAREDAVSAEAQKYSPQLWSDAEETFRDAASRLESGNLNRARNAADDAEREYRAAELDAIETNYLAAARKLIEDAKDQRVDRYAPKTLARAQSLLAQAESELRQNRYDTDYPRSLARQARYEAELSIYLAGKVKAVSDREVTVEDLLIEAQEPISRVAGNLDLVAEFDQGYDAPTQAIIGRIGELLASDQTRREVEEQLAVLETEMTQLETELGQESEQRKLQEQIQRRFQQVAAVFTKEEAQVLRQGDNVIVRLALNFDSGSSVIRPEYFTLLRKIQTAIDVFPDSRVEVQGHTDSFGADDLNLELSEDRAEAVRRYLLANMTLGETAIEAVGFGETSPLANNETAEGRARNRRIDLLIEPNMERLTAALSSP
jgi:OOP family OmpA-OmpF porin